MNSGNTGRKPGKSNYCGRPGHWRKECKKREAAEEGSGPNTVERHAEGEHGGRNLNNYAFITEFNATRPKSCGSMRRSWIVHSGSAKHITSSNEWFQIYEEIAPTKVYVGDGQALQAIGKGNTCILYQGDEITLTDTLHVPEIQANLLSVTRIVNKGY